MVNPRPIIEKACFGPNKLLIQTESAVFRWELLYKLFEPRKVCIQPFAAAPAHAFVVELMPRESRGMQRFVSASLPPHPPPAIPSFQPDTRCLAARVDVKVAALDLR